MISKFLNHACPILAARQQFEDVVFLILIGGDLPQNEKERLVECLRIRLFKQSQDCLALALDVLTLHVEKTLGKHRFSNSEYWFKVNTFNENL